MEGSAGSVQIITEPNPGGPKIYGSYESGSGGMAERNTAIKTQSRWGGGGDVGGVSNAVASYQLACYESIWH
jgi:hypothetical protein